MKRITAPTDPIIRVEHKYFEAYAWFADISLTEVGATPLVPLSADPVAITCS